MPALSGPGKRRPGELRPREIDGNAADASRGEELVEGPRTPASPARVPSAIEDSTRITDEISGSSSATTSRMNASHSGSLRSTAISATCQEPRDPDPERVRAAARQARTRESPRACARREPAARRYGPRSAPGRPDGARAEPLPDDAQGVHPGFWGDHPRTGHAAARGTAGFAVISRTGATVWLMTSAAPERTAPPRLPARPARLAALLGRFGPLAVAAGLSVGITPAPASAGVAWSAPVVVAHGAELDSGAANRSGALALTFRVPGGPPDFSGAPSGSAGLDMLVAAPNGGVSTVAQLTSSTTALGTATALAGDGDAAVTWTDTAAPGAVWAAIRSASGSTGPPQELTTTAYRFAGPVVAADDRGDAAVAWVDDPTRAVLVSFRAPGGSFTAPVLASPGEGSYGKPALTMAADGTTTVAWEATGPPGLVTTGGPPPTPPGLVMAATGPPGGAFSGPRVAIPSPAGATVGATVGSITVADLAARSDASGRVVLSALVGQLSLPGSGPASALIDTTAVGAGPFGATQAIPGLPPSPGSTAPSLALGGGGTLLEAHGVSASSATALQTTLGAAGGGLRTALPYQYAAIGGLSASSIAAGFDAGDDAVVAFTVDHPISTSAFSNGNFAEGSILSVVDRPGAPTWCSAQLISGLISPYYPIFAGFGDQGGGIVGYQQTPKDEIAVAYLRPIAGDCPPPAPTTAAPPTPLSVAAAAPADPKLRSATIQATCLMTGRCRGRLTLLDSRSRTLATGSFSVAAAHTKGVHLQITSRGRTELHSRRRVPVRAVLAVGRRASTVPAPIYLER